MDDIRTLTVMNTLATMTGSVTSVNFSATCGFLAGQFTLMVPIVQGASSHFFSVVGVITGSSTTNSPSNPIRVLVPDTDSSVGAYFDVTYTRTTVGSGSSVAFTVARIAQSGTASDINLDTSRSVAVFLAKGSS